MFNSIQCNTTNSNMLGCSYLLLIWHGCSGGGTDRAMLSNVRSVGVWGGVLLGRRRGFRFGRRLGGRLRYRLQGTRGPTHQAVTIIRPPNASAAAASQPCSRCKMRTAAVTKIAAVPCQRVLIGRFRFPLVGLSLDSRWKLISRLVDNSRRTALRPMRRLRRLSVQLSMNRSARRRSSGIPASATRPRARYIRAISTSAAGVIVGAGKAYPLRLSRPLYLAVVLYGQSDQHRPRRR